MKFDGMEEEEEKWSWPMPQGPQQSTFLQSAHSKERIEKKSLICWWAAAVHSPPIAQINQFHPNKFSFIDLLLSTGQPMYDNTVIILSLINSPNN